MSSAPPPTTTGLCVAFDADDTLWHNEAAFAEIEARFRDMMSPWSAGAHTDAVLIGIERQRVGRYGYGVKSFALALLEAAHRLSNGSLDATHVRTVLDWADELIDYPTVPIDGALETLVEVAADHHVMVITKGDPIHQKRRLQDSGVSDLCSIIEIVDEKDAATYGEILGQRQIEPSRFVMIGNSMVSDVLPVVEVGGRAIHIPYEVTWALESTSTDPEPSDRWCRLSAIREVPSALAEMETQ